MDQRKLPKMKKYYKFSELTEELVEELMNMSDESFDDSDADPMYQTEDSDSSDSEAPQPSTKAKRFPIACQSSDSDNPTDD
ncbi:hypothetical protein QE152_g24903 [Popillia japonica]|uniref:Uncharacterized protein n=1 Tax=Popillia japonica TaxID=7064 RepID=A0AAW1K1W7_POPJA